MTKEHTDKELQSGMDDIAAGRVISADDAGAEMWIMKGH
jgi:predicted transcriptional regulator